MVSQKNSLKPPKDIYEASMKITTYSNQQFPRSLAYDKKNITTLHYFGGWIKNKIGFDYFFT